MKCTQTTCIAASSDAEVVVVAEHAIIKCKLVSEEEEIIYV